MRDLNELEAHSTRATDRWYEQATVRWSGLNEFSQEAATTTSRNQFFSHDALPVEVAAILSKATTEQTVRFELLQLYRHLKFTTLLEHKVVLPCLQDISFESLGCPSGSISKNLRLQALRLVTDEAFHGQRSEELIASLEKRTGVACPYDTTECEFLKALSGQADTAEARLRRFVFCFVSETVISSIIAKNSKGITDPATECFFREHLKDETTHGVFFKAAFTAVWSQMDAAARDRMAPHLGHDLRHFLSTDWNGIVEDLRAVGLEQESKALDGSSVSGVALDCARVTLSAIADVDDDHKIRSHAAFPCEA